MAKVQNDDGLHGSNPTGQDGSRALAASTLGSAVDRAVEAKKEAKPDATAATDSTVAPVVKSEPGKAPSKTIIGARQQQVAATRAWTEV